MTGIIYLMQILSKRKKAEKWLYKNGYTWCSVHYVQRQEEWVRTAEFWNVFAIIINDDFKWKIYGAQSS